MTTPRPGSAASRLEARIRGDLGRIARGERPLYHAIWSDKADGASDVTIQELPLVHLYVPDHDRIRDGARGLIARTLAVDAASFDVVVRPPSLDARSR